MRENSFSLPERKELALKLKAELEREGFKASWSGETEIQVKNLLIPKTVPFDTAHLTIKVEIYYIYFAIVIKFIKVLEDLIGAEEINNVFDLHNDKWHIELITYFSNIDPSGKLQCDVEYDEYIEDNLYGHFDTVEEVIPFIQNLKNLSITKLDSP